MAAETSLTKLCEQFNAIAALPTQPICYFSLTPPLKLPVGQVLPESWTAAQKRQVKRGMQIIGDTSLRLKGYAGWLLTEPAYLAAVEALRSQWLGLPDEQRPSFPLGRPVPRAEKLPHAKAAPEALADFAARLREFLDRWGLLQLTTWELPQPQGPLLPSILPPGAPAMPTHGIHLVLPLHYPLQGDDDLLKRILEFQRQGARDLRLDESLAGLPHHKAYARILDLVHWEYVIRSRCRADHRVRGLNTLIECTLATVLKSSRGQVQKLRNAIRACRRGRRDSVAWLTPRNR